MIWNLCSAAIRRSAHHHYAVILPLSRLSGGLRVHLLRHSYLILDCCSDWWKTG
ncbi:hypothetical protein BDN72DRAFT_184636 [Pluteus cervinus]|uniref:Uncharacterized protein n=1 Tax=Pluteus cervinus TaxID=181527 RepID=A0ACD3B6N9_9AGAR|nr:hypothetical protein BDN72DRAFT_184636 [Pluteus cervinus]